jgi:uncharacterized protein YPO0396
MQEQLLDFAAGDQRAGFRLHRLEVFNWGTFHGRVWTLQPGGDNSLLTGDIGSGKSTLVDAVTTLLVPAQRIVYNKAAGAENRERDLRSYVLGYYKSERGEGGLSVRPVALRDHNSYSVILGHFYNEGFDQHVTLAQVFWIKASQNQPERFYVVADRSLAIAQDFANFGTDINDLRKRLRGEAHVELHDSFPAYGSALRRRFGIDNEQALELFNQTVSMKSVGNLTDFVRSHMLEAFPVDARIQALIQHFDDLDRAHQAVVTAREQVEALTPLVRDADAHADLSARLDELRACRDALRAWFAAQEVTLLDERIAALDARLSGLASRLQTLADTRQSQQAQRDDLRSAIAANGGDRLEQIQAEIAERETRQAERRRRWDQYRRLAEPLDLPVPQDAERFAQARRDIEARTRAVGEERASLFERMSEAQRALQTHREQHEAITEELASLRARQSNLPSAMLALRARLCEAAGLSEDALPFAGELIQVRDDARDWEGAIERLLHHFGLSLLVPDAHYRAVAEWVDRTHLRGRLVYYRMLAPSEARAPQLHPQSLVRKLAIRPDSPCYAWLEQQLGQRFDYACCEDLDSFRREARAITRSGQIKAGGQRHEKDDRHAIDDRTRFILGWSNAAKIAALESQAEGVARQAQAAADRLAALQKEDARLRDTEKTLGQLAVFEDFRDLDWQAVTREIERLGAERRQIEEGSDTLRTLQQQLDTLEAERAATDEAWQKATGEQATERSRRDDAQQAREVAQALLDETPQATRDDCFPQLEAMREEALGGKSITVESCDRRQSEMRDWLQKRIDAEQKRLDRLGESVVRAMADYRHRWPLETREVDAAIEAADEYRRMLERLRADDLPRFEARFKELLNQNTIREVANFQAQLNKECAEIRARIDTINRSLAGIDYNRNRYIALLAEDSADAEIRQFRQDLRACTEDSLTGAADAQSAEAKFLQVKQIIARLRGREGTAELDRRWTRKVTDVRNWFVFSASERWREDDTEFEHYTDSGGKSGGQKEKLAYTVLAASLAYQFGLEWGEQRSRSFRFVVIDEAFGRGSDESARFGLQLFERLNLQLLIVTPLQKIHIIEPFVASVGFVHNEGGQQSLLRNLSIEAYRAERDARAGGNGGAEGVEQAC